MTDLRALVARMADELDYYRQLLMDDRRETHALAAEARAALAESDGPAVQSREPAFVTTEPSDEELRQLYCELFMLQCAPNSLGTAPVRFARAVLARWGNLLKEGETAVEIEATNPWKDAVFDALICSFLLNEENASDPKKALRDLLAWESELARDPLVNPPPQPIPVSERLPEAGDCTAQGWCWVLYQNFATWTLEPPLGQDGKRTGYTHWLPAHALPLPSEEVE